MEIHNKNKRSDVVKQGAFCFCMWNLYFSTYRYMYFDNFVSLCSLQILFMKYLYRIFYFQNIRGPPSKFWIIFFQGWFWKVFFFLQFINSFRNPVCVYSNKFKLNLMVSEIKGAKRINTQIATFLNFKTNLYAVFSAEFLWKTAFCSS